MGVEQGQIGKTEEMADLNKNQDPGVDSLSAAVHIALFLFVPV